MQAAEALAFIRARAVAGRLRYTRHATERMRQRRVLPEDVRHALMDGQRCKAGEGPDKWEVHGADLEGELLKVVVLLVSDVLVVTVHEG